MQVKMDSSLVGAMLIVCFAFGAPGLRADTIVNPSTEYLNRIKGAETIHPLGDTPFGESISLFNGALSFKQTDISYPGIGPDITLTRSYEATGSPLTYGNDLPMGDWDLSIPRIATVVSGNRMGNVGIWKVPPLVVTQNGTTDLARCTHFSSIDRSPYGYGLSWWHGYQLITGDGTAQPLLKRTASNTLAPGNNVSAYPIVTPGHWMISCLPATANALAGEAFLATSPDGTRYWFNHLAYGAALETLVEQIPHMNNPDVPLLSVSGDGSTSTSVAEPTDDNPSVYWGVDEQFLPRKMGYLYATRVEDRFGNWVSYSYDANSHLTEINASDQRKVLITWRTDAPLIDRITLQPGSPDARTWRYEYSSPTVREVRELIRVIQPDQTFWELTMASSNQISVPAANAENQCGIRSFTPLASDDNWSQITIVHPSGLIGNFSLSLRAHARSWVPTMCAQLNGTLEPWVERRPTVYLALSITGKSIQGAGVSPATWTYRYSPPAGSSEAECLASGCRDWKWVEVTDPSMQTSHYQFSTRWGYREGKLQSTVVATTAQGQDFPSGLQVENLSYADPQTAWTFPTQIGQAMEDPIAFSNTAPTETLSPEVLRETVRQSVSFRRQTISFDRFGQAESVNSFSTGGPVKSESISYWPVTSAWVLGQGSTLVSQTDYDSRILPLRVYNFGLLGATYSYATNGTLATIKDPLNNTTTLSNFYRGIPQRIQFADLSVVTPTANTFGQIAAVKNQLGDTTAYSYDMMGRLTRVSFPTGDTVAWNPTLQGLAQVWMAEYGLPAGHWKQTVETGRGRTITFYDVIWRPRLLLTEDSADAITRTFVIKRFDDNSREVFSSYPLASVTTVDDVVPGIRTTYDALGRVTVVSQDSELGMLKTTSEYLDGFRTRITNPRNFQTTTSFQTFDSPSEASPKLILAPEGLTTTIERDLFGKPLWIRREGPGG